MLIVSKSPKSVKLSTISLKCMDPVLLKHGVYHIYTFYYALVPLYSISFYSNTSLKRFLTETEEVKRELASAIARACAYTNTSKKPTKNEYQDNSMEHIAVNVDLEVYLVSPTTPTEVHHVTLSNYLFIAQKWKNSWQFNFSSSMFINGATTNGE